MPADMEGLRKPFPPELIGKLPGSAKRPALDYVGHAAVTDRLLQCAPGWEFEVLKEHGTQGTVFILGRMTIDGVKRDEYGEGDDLKKAISDALKRCAMRFGVALDLWSKEDLQSGSPSIGAAEGAPITSAVGGGGTRTDPKPPEPQAKGMGKAQPADGEGVTGEGGTVTSLPTIQEPHDFVEGRQLASGHWLCKECGKRDDEHG